MIQINIPDVSTKTAFAVAGGYLFGPLSLDGSGIPTEIIEFRGNDDFIETESNIYQENNVSHLQAKGDFTFNALEFDHNLVDDPTPFYPFQRKWGYAGMPGNYFSLTAQYGLAREIEYLEQYQRYVVNTSSNSFSWIELGGTRRTAWHAWETVVVTIKSYSNPRISPRGYILFDVTINTRGASGRELVKHIDWDVQKSRSGVIAAWQSLPVMSIVTTTENLRGGFPRENIRSSLSITQARRDINSLCRRLLYTKFDYELEHPGVLAERASQKVNANKVNMIAFLADLKNPRAMIPKLRNLSKLKDLADGYLSVEYGLLPTIDDLKSIVEAFQRSRPYLDKNGFKTYNAVHTIPASNSLATLSITQRIKLAISDMDEGMHSLANSLDNAGFFPTFENLWDLIPYSFVIDWFVNVGDILERIDTRLRLARLPIKYVTTSTKFVTTLKALPENFTRGLHGSLSLVQYSRGTSDRCPVPPIPSLGTDISAQNHVIEGSALIIQRGSK